MIRAAVLEDAGSIETLMKSAPGLWDTAWRRDVVPRVLGSPDAIALVHDNSGFVDGFACAHDLGFRGYLSKLVVSPQSQRRGVGSQLLFEIERRLTARGCLLIIGDVWSDAEQFYRLRGWTPPSVVLLRKRFEDRAAEQAVQGGLDPPSPSEPGR